VRRRLGQRERNVSRSIDRGREERREVHTRRKLNAFLLLLAMGVIILRLQLVRRKHALLLQTAAGVRRQARPGNAPAMIDNGGAHVSCEAHYVIHRRHTRHWPFIQIEATQLLSQQEKELVD
jgi:hypothetical protein